MEYHHPSSGGYYRCKQCNKIDIPVNMGNTFKIDEQYEKEYNV